LTGPALRFSETSRFSQPDRQVNAVIRRRKATRKETLMAEKKAQGKLAHAKGTQKSAKSTTKQAATKAAARPGPRKDKPILLAGGNPQIAKADGERM
jgi:hypothetical protein